MWHCIQQSASYPFRHSEAKWSPYMDLMSAYVAQRAEGTTFAHKRPSTIEIVSSSVNLGVWVSRPIGKTLTIEECIRSRECYRLCNGVRLNYESWPRLVRGSRVTRYLPTCCLARRGKMVEALDIGLNKECGLFINIECWIPGSYLFR
jgi:hypothetical protein